MLLGRSPGGPSPLTCFEMSPSRSLQMGRLSRCTRAMGLSLSAEVWLAAGVAGPWKVEGVMAAGWRLFVEEQAHLARLNLSDDWSVVGCRSAVLGGQTESSLRGLQLVC